MRRKPEIQNHSKPSWPLHKKIATKRPQIQSPKSKSLNFGFWIGFGLGISDFEEGSTRITTRPLGDGDVWWFPTISHVKIWNHPFETTIKKKLLFRVPGGCIFSLSNGPTSHPPDAEALGLLCLTSPTVRYKWSLSGVACFHCFPLGM